MARPGFCARKLDGALCPRLAPPQRAQFIAAAIFAVARRRPLILAAAPEHCPNRCSCCHVPPPRAASHPCHRRRCRFFRPRHRRSRRGCRCYFHCCIASPSSSRSASSAVPLPPRLPLPPATLQPSSRPQPSVPSSSTVTANVCVYIHRYRPCCPCIEQRPDRRCAGREACGQQRARA